MHANYIPQLKEYFNYSFTTVHGFTPNQEYNDARKLSRFGLESATLQTAKTKKI